MTTDTPALVDALPYIDTAIDDNDALRETAMKMVDDEMMDYPPDKDYLDYLADISFRPFLTDVIRSELQALNQNELRSTSRDLSKVEVDIPPPANSNMDKEEMELWNRCINQIKVRLEYTQRQAANLDLLKTFGVPAWEQYIADNERLELNIKQETGELESKLQEINSQRKSDQDKVSRHLEVLQTHWDNLSVSNRLLAEEIEKVRNQLGATQRVNNDLKT